MSIAAIVKAQLTSENASVYSADSLSWFSQERAKEAGGVYLREASAADGIKSTFLDPWGWVYGFADGSQLAIVYNGAPVVIAEKGSINYPQQQKDEEERRQNAWLENLPKDAKIIHSGGSALIAIGRAWWISHALEIGDGRISVARIYAKDKDEKLYIIDLTEEMLAEYDIAPGRLKSLLVIDGDRPKTNRIDRPTSQKSYQKLMNDLQNERGVD